MRNSLFSLAIIFLLISGCSNSSEPTTPTEATVTGIVLKIEDYVPVDGGVRIDVQVGETVDTLLLGSSETLEPVPASYGEMYRTIQNLEIGEAVQATGVRNDEGLALTSLSRMID